MNKLLTVSPSPHIHGNDSVKKNMYGVIIALLPALAAAVWYFGLGALVVSITSIAACMLFEYLIQRFMLKTKTTLSDGSAIVTGLLLAFNLPSNLPVWMIIIGAAVAIAWPRPEPIWSFGVDAITGPTPLGILKEGIGSGKTVEQIISSTTNFPSNLDMLFGQMGGSFGEVSFIVLLVGALFLIFRKVITWHIPVSFILSAFLLSGFAFGAHIPKAYRLQF